MYDEKRVAHLVPIRTAVQSTGLPLVKMRKLNTILNALEMQIEDGGDSPEVNDLLIQALRKAVEFQLGEQLSRPILAAIEQFSVGEKKRRPGR